MCVFVRVCVRVCLCLYVCVSSLNEGGLEVYCKFVFSICVEYECLCQQCVATCIHLCIFYLQLFPICLCLLFVFLSNLFYVFLVYMSVFYYIFDSINNNKNKNNNNCNKYLFSPPGRRALLLPLLIMYHR